MENRITRLLFPLLIALAAFLLLRSFFGPKRPPRASDAVRAGISRVIDPKTAPRVLAPADWERLPPKPPAEAPADRLGKPGFIVQYDSLGGGVRSIWLTNFYEHPGVEPRPGLPFAELYQAVRAEEEGIYSFVLEDYKGRFLVKNPANEGSKFGVPIEELHWRRAGALAGGGVRYRLALSNGLTFEKDIVPVPGSYELRIVLRIKNSNAALGGRVFGYKLRGATVMATDPPGASYVSPPKVFAAWRAGGELKIAQMSGDGRPNPADYPDLMRVNQGERFLYAGSSNRFFTCILFPADEATRRAVKAVEAVKLPLEEKPGIPAFKNGTPLIRIDQPIPEPQAEKPGTSELSFRVYVGPKDRDLFASTRDYEPFLAAADLDYNIACFCAPGASTIGKLLLHVLKFFHSLLGNWGFAIILLTVLVRGALSPLNYRQMKAMAAYQARMAKFKPKLDAIKKKYEKDPKRLNQELMKFNKEHKLFPPLMGCLPMFLTMPIFFGLFTMLRASFELRHQPFLAWIKDLSQPDRLFEIGDTGLFFVPRYFNLLPILMIVFWVLTSFSQKLPDDPQQRQQQQMMRFMPIIFGVMLYNYASGLALYMVVSSMWAMVEQRLLRRRLGVGAAGVAPAI